MKNKETVKDTGWKKFLKTILRLVIIVVVASVVLPILYVVVFFIMMVHPILPKLEKSTLNTQVIFNNSGLQNWRRVYQGDVVFYKNKNTTILRQIDSGNEVVMSVISPSLFITPKDKNYFLVGAREGKAYLIGRDGILIKEYDFSPVKVLEGEFKPSLFVINDQNGYPSMGGWLDDNTLFTINGIFDLNAGKLLSINSLDPVINLTPWKDENRDCRTDGEGVGFCYHIKCLPNSNVFDTSEYDRAPSKSIAERNFCSGCEGKRAYMENADIQCLLSNTQDSYLIGEKQDPYLLVRKSDNQWYGIKVRLNFFGDKPKVIKNVPSIWGRTYWNQYLDKDIDKTVLSNGGKYQLTNKFASGGFDSPPKISSTLTLYNQKDEIVGSLSRRDIQLVNDHWRGENKILFLSEKGLEVLNYENKNN